MKCRPCTLLGLATILAGGCAIETTEGAPTTSVPSECAYPAGPFGVDAKQTVPRVFAWEGYVPGAQGVSLIQVGDFFDCDGTRDIDAVLFDSSAVGCEGCQLEATEFESHFDTWEAAGLRIHVITLLVPGEHGVPTMNTLSVWKEKFQLESTYLALDTGHSMVPPGDGFPVLTVVDPRTMRVVQVQRGFAGVFPEELEALAQANKPH